MKKSKLTTNIFFALVMTFVLLFVGQIIGGIFTGLLAGVSGVGEDGLIVLLSYLPFIGIIAMVYLFTWLTRKDLFPLYFRGSRGNTIPMLGLGLLTGFLMNGACILVAYLHGDIHFEPGNLSLTWGIISFAVVFIQSSAEEILTRGYLFYHVREGYGRTLALIVSGLLFALLHVGNPGVTPLALVNIAAVGIFYALCVEYLDSLWFAMANHAMWNFTQNFIFGLPNSGLVSRMSILKLEAASDSAVYSSIFGVEAAIPATVVCGGCALALFLWARKRQATPATKEAA